MSTESDFYRGNVDAEMDRRLLRHAFLAVRVAQIDSRRYPDQELDAVPPMRRLNFQHMVLFGAFPGGAAVVRESHSGGSHVALHSGGVTVTSLTRSHLPRKVVVQPYQETLAQPAQWDLFAATTGTPISSKLWGLLLYGGDYRSTKLTLCKMTFPAPDGTFAPGTIDFLAEYPEIVRMFDDEEYVTQLAVEYIAVRDARRA